MSNEKKNDNNQKTQEIMNQFEDSLRTVIREGKFGHRELEKHLNNVMQQMSEEVRNRTMEMLKELEAEEEKKTVSAHSAAKKPRSMREKQK